MQKLPILTLALVFCLHPEVIIADIYSWTDEKGIKHFSTEPPSNVKEINQDNEYKQNDDLYEKSEEEQHRKIEEILGKVPIGSDKRVTKNPGKVIIFSRTHCGECGEAREFFEEFCIPFTEYNLDKDEEALARFEALGGKRVPTIFIGKKRFNTFYAPHIVDLFGIEYYNPAKIKHKIIKKKNRN